MCKHLRRPQALPAAAVIEITVHLRYATSRRPSLPGLQRSPHRTRVPGVRLRGLRLSHQVDSRTRTAGSNQTGHVARGRGVPRADRTRDVNASTRTIASARRVGHRGRGSRRMGVGTKQASQVRQRRSNRRRQGGHSVADRSLLTTAVPRMPAHGRDAQLTTDNCNLQYDRAPC